MATYYNILVWRMPQTEEPGGLQFIGLQRVGHNLELNSNHKIYKPVCVMLTGDTSKTTDGEVWK